MTKIIHLGAFRLFLLALVATFSTVFYPLRHISSAVGESLNWNLPVILSDSNSIVTFEVDSTWHLVVGKTAKISGEIHQRDPSDLRSIEGEITIPVGSFDTDSSMRDSKLRQVMDEESYKNVQVKLSGLSGDCTPVRIPCSGTISATLSIRGTPRELALPFSVERRDGALLISGETKFRWGDFGVEDPSILVAKLAEIVTVKYQVKI